MFQHLTRQCERTLYLIFGKLFTAYGSRFSLGRFSKSVSAAPSVVIFIVFVIAILFYHSRVLPHSSPFTHYRGLSLSSQHLTRQGKTLVPTIQFVLIIPALSLPARRTTLLSTCLTSENDRGIVLVAVVALGCMDLDFHEFIVNVSGHDLISFKEMTCTMKGSLWSGNFAEWSWTRYEMPAMEMEDGQEIGRWRRPLSPEK